MRGLRIGAVAGALSLVLGCGAVDGPGTEQTTPARSGGPSGVGAPGSGQGGAGGGSGQGSGSGSGSGGKEYPWSLPGGDPGLTVAVGAIYMAIRAGDCAGAQAKYDAYGESGGTLSDEGDKTILRVGIALCRGDRATALNEFASYEWPGYSDNWFQCQLYAVAGSVLRHRPPSSFADCPAVQPGTGTSDSPSPEVSPDDPPTDGSPPPTDEPSPSAEPS
ncbi:hypothetical protein [Actinomadura litoris]|uniref:hypothetical protein n=1 Tax=Actinomadura litoris TaxID=2678616 RepID=UPI001FA7848E|nr:hypothetical protein [Actinomadura litoris]